MSSTHGTCKYCGMPILEFSFKDGKQWWHADPTGRSRHLGSITPAYRRCGADPRAPFAEPA